MKRSNRRSSSWFVGLVLVAALTGQIRASAECGCGGGTYCPPNCTRVPVPGQPDTCGSPCHCGGTSCGCSHGPCGSYYIPCEGVGCQCAGSGCSGVTQCANSCKWSQPCEGVVACKCILDTEDPCTKCGSRCKGTSGCPNPNRACSTPFGRQPDECAWIGTICSGIDQGLLCNGGCCKVSGGRCIYQNLTYRCFCANSYCPGRQTPRKFPCSGGNCQCGG